MKPTDMFLDLWQNPWRAPDEFALFGIPLEGPMPSEAELAAERDEVAQARSEWRPDAAAKAMLSEFADMVGARVTAKFWHPLIVAMDVSEGPVPVTGTCRGIIVERDGTGAVQAFLLLADPVLAAEEEGCIDPRPQFIQELPSGDWRINVGDLWGLVSTHVNAHLPSQLAADRSGASSRNACQSAQPT